MNILVDTNVILDVVRNDPEWVEWSEGQLARHEQELAVNPLIYAELCYAAHSSEEVDELLEELSLGYLELPRPALFLAAGAFRAYKARGGVRTAPLAGFFIGAHAQSLQMPLLTRDAARYRTYFPKISLISPESR